MENETQMTEKQSYLQQHLMSIPELEVGQIVTGTVVQTNDESVLVDIGYKSEGKIPVDEFMELPKLGDKVAVTIVKLDDGRGQVVVSKKRAEAKEKAEMLKKAEAGKYALGGGGVVVPRAYGARKGHVASAVAGREQLFAHAPLLLEHEHIVPSEPRGEIQPRSAASYDSGIENHLSPSLEQTRGRPRAHRGCPPPHGSSRRESGHFAGSQSFAGSSAGVHTFTICAAKLSATLRSTV